MKKRNLKISFYVVIILILSILNIFFSIENSKLGSKIYKDTQKIENLSQEVSYKKDVVLKKSSLKDLYGSDLAKNMIKTSNFLYLNDSMVEIANLPR